MEKVGRGCEREFGRWVYFANMPTTTQTIGCRWTHVRRIAALGEPLLELQPTDDGQIRVAFGGDAANVAVCLARLLGTSKVQISVVTALGQSSYSDWLRARLTREGIRVTEAPIAGEPGIYGIPLDAPRQATDRRGQATFSYWRTQSAARQFLQSAQLQHFQELLGQPDLLLISGIALALCSTASFESLCEWIQLHRHECSVIFDCNYRKALWPSDQHARDRIGTFEKLASVIATGVEDERLLWDAADTTEVIKRVGSMGVEYIVRGGRAGCWAGVGEQWDHVASIPVQAIDTAGAGDAHLAGYVAARVSGCGRAESAEFANTVAAVIVSQHGSAAVEGAAFPALPGTSPTPEPR